MGSVKLLAILLVLHCVYAGKLVRRMCNDVDGPEYEACMKQSFRDIISDNAAGVPDKGIKAMDPMIIDHIDVLEEAQNMKSHFTNLKVTGLKNAIVPEYHEEETDIESKVKFTVKLDFIAEGPVRIEFLKKAKSLSGNIKYEGGVQSIITYNYITKKIDGKETYEIGPENIECESQSAKSTLSEDLITALGNDPDAKAQMPEYEKIKIEHQAKVVCTMAKAIFKNLVENFRVLGRLVDP